MSTAPGAGGASPLDPASYLAAIRTTDFLRLVVMGHLYLEALLFELVRRRMSNPSALHQEDFDFPQIVELAAALGIIQSHERRPLASLNRMRNRLAHELNAVITIGDVEDFLKTLTADQRSRIEGLTGRNLAWGIDLRPALIILYTDLHGRLP